MLIIRENENIIRKNFVPRQMKGCPYSTTAPLILRRRRILAGASSLCAGLQVEAWLEALPISIDRIDC